MASNQDNWRISREQAIAVGVVVGFFIGLRAGPVVKVLAAIALFCLFALFGRAMERHFESRLGLIGFFGVVAVLSSMSGIRNALEGVMEVLLLVASMVGLAVLGGAGAMRLYDTVVDDATPAEGTD